MGRLFNLKYAGRQADENTRDHVFLRKGRGRLEKVQMLAWMVSSAADSPGGPTPPPVGVCSVRITIIVVRDRGQQGSLIA